MRALIVDDVPSMRHFLAMCLAEFSKIEIEEAGDGMEAATKISKQRYDLVLLDLNLPLMDGFKVLALLRSRPPPENDTPVILITTAGDEAVRARAQEMGAHFLPKPVHMSAVRELVHKVCNLPKPAPPDGAERRETPRLRLPMQVRFIGQRTRELTCSDVNALGAFLACDDPEPVGSRGVLSLHFPHMTEPLDVDCVVVHVRVRSFASLPRGFGVRFEPKNSQLGVRLARAFTSPDNG